LFQSSTVRALAHPGTQFEKLPNMPPGFTKKFMEMARGEDLVELIVPVYLKHLEDATLDAAIAFYETDHGRKLIQVQPVIAQESMEIGQKWGQEIALKVMKSLQEKEQDKDP
jgi:hypothetical protein